MELKLLGSNQTSLTLEDGTVVFFSYNTPVAAFVPDQGYLKSDWAWSVTTRKHINRFLDGHAYKIVSQQVIDNLLRKEER